MSGVVNTNLIKALEDGGFTPEVAEIRRGYYDYTGYPKPVKKFWLGYKSENYSIEETYFWMMGHAMNDRSMPYVHKITDVFAASQGSTMFGDLGSRLSALQSQASNLLATFGQMSKDLFKHVRDLRKIRERLAYYIEADPSLSLEDRKKKIATGAENTLKDIWITLVEGGAEAPSSVYGMAKMVQFTILPDLFFQAPPLQEDEIKQYCKDLDGEFNPTVILALERKLYQFYHWKKLTYSELSFKERHQKKLIYQHYQSMKLYLSWVKPYIKNAQKLTGDDSLSNNYNIISSFQTNLTEIEVLLERPMGAVTEYDSDGKESKVGVSAVVIIHFLYETTPEMSYHAKESWQQKAPSHAGKVDVQLRAYGWTSKQIEKYKKVKVDEEIGMMKAIDFSLQDEGDMLGKELREVLDEVEEEISGEPVKKDEEKKEKKKSVSELLKERKKKISEAQKEMQAPFSGLLGGIKEVTIDAFAESKQKKVEEAAKSKKKKAIEAAEKEANGVAWQVYKNYKKAHKMYTW